MKKEQLRTPCYIIDKNALIHNLEILRYVKQQSGCKILLAQKCFSMYSLYPLIGEYVDGCTASGLFEAKLGREEMNKENHVFSPAYREDEIDEIIGLCDDIVFNSFSQLGKYIGKVKSLRKEAGIRINPEFSTQKDHELYDPCAEGSRLGVTLDNFDEAAITLVDGLHFHTLCEQNSDDLKKTLDVVEEKFGKYLYGMKWINFGGGHHITRDDYDLETLISCIKHFRETYNLDVYLEPGEAFVLNAGSLLTTVLETGKNGIRLAIVDTSAACHMPDVLEMPYTPPLKGSGAAYEKEYTYRLGGPTCLSGDIIGDYSFDHELENGEKLEFLDMALYTMVKTNMFNGMNLPDIVIKDGDEYALHKTFGYEDFKSRL